MQAQSNNQKSEHVESQKPGPEAALADKRPVQSRLGRQEARPEAVLGARRPVRRPSWPPRGSPGGRQERQEARLEAILNAIRPVQRPSWTPGGSSAGRLGRQEARMQVLLQFLQQYAGFAQAAVWGHRPKSPYAAKPHCTISVSMSQ